MVRTKADNVASTGSYRKAVAARAPRKSLGAGGSAPSDSTSPTSKKDNKYAGGNPVCVRPIPEWQKGIGDFFGGPPMIRTEKENREPSDDEAGGSGSGKAVKSKKKNSLASDDEGAGGSGSGVVIKSKKKASVLSDGEAGGSGAGKASKPKKKKSKNSERSGKSKQKQMHSDDEAGASSSSKASKAKKNNLVSDDEQSEGSSGKARKSKNRVQSDDGPSTANKPQKKNHVCSDDEAEESQPDKAETKTSSLHSEDGEGGSESGTQRKSRPLSPDPSDDDMEE